MESWWFAILNDQVRSGFREVAGAKASMELPIADWWLSGIITGLLKPEWPIREVGVQALAGNELAVRIHLRRPAFLPAIKVRLAIEEQPRLPPSPILTLRIARDGVTDIARTALRFLDALPAGIRLQGDRVLVDLGALADRHGFAEVLEYLTTLEVTTVEGKVNVLVEAAIAPARTADARP